MHTPLHLYIASGLGFTEAGRYFYLREVIPLCQRLGFIVLDPWILTPQSKIDAVAAMLEGPARRDAWRTLNLEIAGNNAAAIDRADLILAVLDGVEIDSGAASEIGYAAARGKPVIGYRSDFRQAGDNEGAMINLQVEYFVRLNGGGIVTTLEALAGELAFPIKRS